VSRFRLLDAATGEAVEVSSDEARQGLAQGTLRAGASVRLRSADGRLFEAPGEQVGSLLQSGDFDLDTPEAAEERRLQREYGDAPVRAGLAGAARGVTFGLSDQAAVALGGEDTQTALRELEERNQGASIAGEVVGTAAPLLLSGGASAAGTAARGVGTAGRILRGVTAPARGLAALSEGAGIATTRALGGASGSAARRILARGIGTGVEGAIEGVAGEAGRIVTEDALGYEPDLAADAVIARLGLGAVLGGGAGSVLGGSFATLGEGFRGAQRVGREGLDVIRRGWQQQVGTELDGGVAELWALASGRPAEAIRDVVTGPGAREARELILEGDAGLDGAARALIRDLGEVERVGQHVRDFWSMGLKRDQMNRLVRRDAGEAQIAAARSAMMRARGLADELFTDQALYRPGVGARARDLQRAADAFGNEIELAAQRMGQGADGASADLFVALDGFKRRLGSAQQALERVDGEATRRVRDLYESDFRRVLESDDLWGEAAGAQRAVNEVYTRYLEPREQFRGFFLGDQMRDTVDPFRMLSQPDSARIVAALQAAGTASNDTRARVLRQVLESGDQLNRAMREYLDLPPGLAAQIDASSEATGRALQTFGRAERRGQVLGQWRALQGNGDAAGMLAGALGGGAGAAFALGGPGAAAGLGAAAAGLNMIANPQRIARGLAVIERFARKTDERIGQAVQGFLRRGVNAAGEAARRGRRAVVAGGAQAYRERTRQLEEEANDMQRRLETSTRDMSNAPRTQQALQTRASQAVAFLQRVRPQGRTLQGELLAGKRERLPSGPEMERFMRYARAVDDPETVLADLEAGRLSREGVEVLRQVYPALYQRLVTRTMEALQDLDTQPPYQERLQLGMLLGVPTDPSLTPAFLATIQQTHAIASAQQPQQHRAAVTRAPDIAGSFASDTDRLVARRQAT
jgi:hypothetical protein